MKPPPPMLPALGCVTASANAVATAASTALPWTSIEAPASQAGAETQTTRPSFEGTPRSVVAGGCVREAAAAAANIIMRIEGLKVGRNSVERSIRHGN